MAKRSEPRVVMILVATRVGHQATGPGADPSEVTASARGAAQRKPPM